MRNFILFILMVLSLNSYELVVKSNKDAKKLKEIGLICKKYNDMYVCLQNNHLAALKRIKDFLYKEYNIKSYIVSSNTVDKKIYNKQAIKTNKSVVKNSKSLYCIQLFSSHLPISKKEFERYQNFPYARVEKIGKYYVLRVGADSYAKIKSLYNKIKKGYIRKCDLISQRIIFKNFDVYSNQQNDINESKNMIVNKANKNISKSLPIKVLNSIKNEDSTINIKALYYYLNNGDLNKAENLAKKFYNRGYIKDSLYVLGLVSLKKQKFKDSCNYFTKLEKLNKSSDVESLKNKSCETYYLKLGFNYLNIDPKKSEFYFKKSLEFNDNLDARIGLAYSYLNLNEKEKALKIAEELYNKYPNNKKVIILLAQIYSALGEYEKVDNLAKKYPTILRKSDVLFYSNLKKAQDLLKKDPLKAENILLSLYKENPTDINLLLTLGNLYLQMNKLDKAASFYENVLFLSPSNFYALKGLEVIYLKEQKYKEALKYSDKILALGYSDEDRQKIKNNISLKEARKYIQENNLEKAKELLEKVNEDIPDKYILLGDIFYKSKDNFKAYKYYAKAYSLKPNDFDIKLKFLYSLLKLNLYEQIKIVLDSIDEENLTPSQKLKLKNFYNDLLFKYASYLLEKKEYQKALTISERGLKQTSNYKFYSIKGWSCYNLGNLKCAEESFKNYLKYNLNDANIKYGLALVLYQEGKNEEAKKVLDSIHTNDKELKVNIAELYALIGDTKNANNILNNLEKTPSTKKKVLNFDNLNNNDNNFNANKSFIDGFLDDNYNLNNNTQPIKIVRKNKVTKKINKIKKIIELVLSKKASNISSGFFFRSKSGESGTSKLNYFNPFFAWDFYKNNIEFYGNFNFIILNSGDIINYNKVGSANIVNYNIISNFITLERDLSTNLGIRITKDNKLFDIGVGITPFKASVSPTFTGHFKYQIRKVNKKYSFTFYRKSVKDSILSFVGNVDPYTNKVWGRVLENGLLYEYENLLDKNDSMFYFGVNYGYLNGFNVFNNNKLELIMFPLWYIGEYILNKDYLGVYFNVYGYQKDQNSFYYKYGGYFSPRLFLMLGPRYEGYVGNYENFLLKVMVNPAICFHDDASANLYFDGGVSGIYLINKNFSLEGGFDIRTAGEYNDFLFLVNLKYYFGKKFYIFKQDVDKILKRISSW